MYNPYQQYNYMQPTSTNGITWVQGIEGAKAYQLSPNTNAQLMDSENDGVFYIKVCDNVGMCTLRVFKYTEVTSNDVQKPNVELSEYVRKDELQSLIMALLPQKEVANEQSIQPIKQKSLLTT